MGNKLLSIVFAWAIAVLAARATAYADSLPVYDIGSSCSAYVIQSETTSAKDRNIPHSRDIKIKSCVIAEQRAYDILKTEWDALNQITKTPCLLDAEKYMRSGSYYSSLNRCIQSRIRYDMFPNE